MACGHPKNCIAWRPSAKQKKCWRTFRSLVSRIPLASFVAFAMCVIGAVAFCGSLYRALEYLLVLLDLDIVSKLVWLIMIIHIGLASLFLFVAILSTGDTREEVCTRCTGCNFLGRCCQITMIVIAYIFHLIWLFLPFVMIIIVALVTGIMIMCQVVPDCIHLRDYGLTAKDIEQYGPAKIMSTLNSIDEEQIEQAIIKASEIIEKTAATINSSIPTNLAGMLDQLDTSKLNLDQIKKNIPVDQINSAIQNARNQTRDTNVTSYAVSRTRRSLDVDMPDLPFNYSQLFDIKLPSGFGDIDIDDLAGDRLSLSMNLITSRVEQLVDAAEQRQEILQSRVDALTKQAEGIQDPQSDAHKQLETAKAMAKEANSTLTKVKSKAGDVLRYAQDMRFASASGAQDQASSATKRAKEAAMELYSNFEDSSPLLDAMKIAKYAEEKARKAAKEAEKHVREAMTKANETLAYARSLADQAMREKALQKAEALKKVADEAKVAAENARKEAMLAIGKSQETAMAVAAGAKDRAKELAAKARQFATVTVMAAGNRTLHTAMTAANEAAKEAQAVARKAQERVQEAAKQAQEAARNAAKAVGEEAKKKAEAAKKAAEAVLNEAKEAALAAKDQAEKAFKDAQETVQAVAQNAAEKARKFAEQARASAEAAVKAAAETAMSTVMETANKAVEVAQKAAADAMREAQAAAKRAEELARRVASEADAVLREKAKEAEKIAREIADRAMAEAEKAMAEASKALEQAEKTIKAVAEGALDLAKEYAAKAEQAARHALHEAQKTAREVRKNAKTYAKMVTRLREEVNKIYAIAVDIAIKLDIKMESGDRVCSGAVRVFCVQVNKSFMNLCICAAASIIINLSMVHFLMAMSANYVHIKRELDKEETEEEIAENHEMKSVPDERSRFMTSNDHVIIT